MNQIIFPQTPEESPKANVSPKSKAKMKLRLYQTQLYFASGLLVLLFFIFLGFRFYQSSQENYSQVLLDQYHVSTLYANTENVTRLSTTVPTNTPPFIIGMLEIDAIKLNYPILSESTNELLTISPCRFAGPMPNEVGNLCIAGHNYADNRFFGRLDELSYDDIVKVFDLSGHMEEYVVSAMARVSANDTRCAGQDTGGKKMVTLLTCNNLSTTRLAVQCIQK